MKLLLDENLPHELRLLLMPMHEPFTVSYMQWKGVKNGELLSLAAAERFDAFITTDQGIEYEQNQAALPCAVVILKAPSNQVDDLRPLVTPLLRTLKTLRPRTLAKAA